MPGARICGGCGAGWTSERHFHSGAVGSRLRESDWRCAVRCKVGDLVEVIFTYKGKPGALTCNFNPRGMVGTITGPARLADCDWSVFFPGRRCPAGDGTWAAHDEQLRPIADPDAADETIRIAGLPREVAHG